MFSFTSKQSHIEFVTDANNTVLLKTKMTPRPQNKNNGIKNAPGARIRKTDGPELETLHQDFLVEFPQGRYSPQTSPVSESGMYI